MRNGTPHASDPTIKIVEPVKPQKILLVDDDSMVRSLCKTVLASNGFNVVTAANGEEGLAVYREHYKDICLVLSDVTMPVMDGIEMIRSMFELHSHSNVILMSGNFTNVDTEQVTRLCSMLPKPFTPAQLMKAVQHCLKYQREHYLLPQPA